LAVISFSFLRESSQQSYWTSKKKNGSAGGRLPSRRSSPFNLGRLHQLLVSCLEPRFFFFFTTQLPQASTAAKIFRQARCISFFGRRSLVITLSRVCRVFATDAANPIGELGLTQRYLSAWLANRRVLSAATEKKRSGQTRIRHSAEERQNQFTNYVLILVGGFFDVPACDLGFFSRDSSGDY